MKYPLLSLLLITLLLLSGCAAKTEYAFTASAKQFMYNGYRYYQNAEGLLAYSSPDGRENLLCYDPLCTHNFTECPSYLWFRPYIAVVPGDDGTPIVYYTDRVLDFAADKQTSRLYRMEMKEGRRTILTEQEEMINQFWLYGNELYLTIQYTSYDEQGQASGIGSNLFVMNADGGNLRPLTQYTENSVSIVGITEEKGERTIYWVSHEDSCLYASSSDFQTTTEVIRGVPLYGSFLHDGWLYYMQKSEKRAEALLVDVHPQDKTPAANGKVTIRAEKQLYACYRMKLSSPDAEPELLFDGVDGPTSVFSPMVLAEETLLIIPYEPTFIEAIAATMKGETGDAAADSLGERMQIDYIVTDSASKLLALDLSSRELRTIPTPGFDPKSIIGMNDTKLIVSGNVVDGEHIREKLSAEGVRSSSYVFTEIQMIDRESLYDN